MTFQFKSLNNVIKINWKRIVNMHSSSNNEVKCVIEELCKLLSSDAMLHSWYSQANDLVDSIGVVSEVPRTAGHQQYRDNVEHNSEEEYFRRTVIPPLLSWII